jgi:hypothetical protein
MGTGEKRPLAEVLHQIRDQKLPIYCDIELEYPVNIPGQLPLRSKSMQRILPANNDMNDRKIVILVLCRKLLQLRSVQNSGG